VQRFVAQEAEQFRHDCWVMGLIPGSGSGVMSVPFCQGSPAFMLSTLAMKRFVKSMRISLWTRMSLRAVQR